MKAKFYIGIISALLLAGSPMAAQFADNSGFRDDNTGLVVNNYYYNDYDYYFASRINRFHRSYAAFDYYSPMFTETYWYNYRPYSWGTSIYGGGGFGFGFRYSYRYPIYSYSWYDPYFGSSWYWDYDPFYYSWYSPVIININIGPRWRNYYSGWYGYNRWYNNYNRPVYYSSDNYRYNNATRYSSRDYPYRNRSDDYNRSNSGEISRRAGTSSSGSRSVINNDLNTGTRGNNIHSQQNSKNGNFDNKGSNSGTPNRVAPVTAPANRRIEQPAPSGRSGSSGSRATVSQGSGRGSSGSAVKSSSSGSKSRSSDSSSKSSSGSSSRNRR